VSKKIRHKQTLIRNTLIWVGIILLAAFWLTVRGADAPVGITVLPESPRQGG